MSACTRAVLCVYEGEVGGSIDFFKPYVCLATF